MCGTSRCSPSGRPCCGGSGSAAWAGGGKWESFAVRLDQCLERLRGEEFAAHIHTDTLTIPQVADRIARSAGLPIVPDTDGPLRGRLRRYAVGVRHIRFG